MYGRAETTSRKSIEANKKLRITMLYSGGFIPPQARSAQSNSTAVKD
ncbi:hypothetical protein HYX12_02190 [Candidatus Woesearchaeota archaeon]|nr:hypothetical protein [Candidatus Woesearchaeota archaeon]